MTKTFTKEEGTLVELDGEIYLIDNNFEIKVGDWVLEFQKNDLIGEICYINTEYVLAKDIQKKIIASTKDIGLPLIDRSQLNIDNFEKIAKELVEDEQYSNISEYNKMVRLVITGYKANTKQFTLEDMKSAVRFGMILERFKKDSYKLSDNEEFKEFIKECNQNEIKGLEIEMEQYQLYISPDKIVQYDQQPKEMQSQHTINPTSLHRPKLKDNHIIITNVIY